MFEGLPLVGLTAPGVLLLVVLLILTGRLIPKATLQDKNDEAKEWRKAYEAEREARTIAVKQTGELLELAKTTDSFIRAVFTSSERIRQSGGTDVSS